MIDISFPEINPAATEEEVEKMAEKYAEVIAQMSPEGVMCQGEMTLCFRLVTLLKIYGITSYAACTERDVEEKGEIKTVKFHFVKFRAYT